MQLEEVLIKLGVDTTQVEPAILKAKVAVEGGAKSFVKAGSAAKGFKKILEEVTDQSPVMGTALKLAINPVVGTLTAATVIFAKLSGYIDELNKKLDEISDKNALPIGNAKEAARNAREQVQEIRRAVDEANKANAQKGNPLFDKFEQEKAALQRSLAQQAELRADAYEKEKRRNDDLLRAKLITEDQHTARARNIDDRQKLTDRRAKLQEQQQQLALLGRQRLQLVDAGIVAEKERDTAANDSADDTRKRTIEKGKQQVDELNQKIETLKAQLPALQRAASDADTTYEKRVAELGDSPYASAALGLAKAAKDDANKPYEDAREQLERYQRALDQTKETISKLTQTDKTAAEALKLKQSALDQVIAKLKEVAAEQRKLQDQVAPTAPNEIDPRTGGVAYHGLEYHGLTYKPIKGAPGFSPPKDLNAMEQPMTIEQQIAGLKKAMEQLVAAATKDGMIVQGKETA